MLGTTCLNSLNVIVNANRNFLVIKNASKFMAPCLTFFTYEIQKLIVNKPKFLQFSERQSCKWLIKTVFIEDAGERGGCCYFLWACRRQLQPDCHCPGVNYEALWPMPWASGLSPRFSFWKVKIKLLHLFPSIPYSSHFNPVFPIDQVQYCFRAFFARGAHFSLFLCLAVFQSFQSALVPNF